MKSAVALNCGDMDTRILDEALRDGFRIALLGATFDAAHRRLRARLLRFEGGRLITESRGELDLQTGQCDLEDALREALREVAAPPHLLVIWGNAARTLLARTVTTAMLAGYRVLDLRRAVLALRPEVRARASADELLAAMSVGGAADPESPMDDRVADLLWAVLAEAQQRGWNWNELITRSSLPRSLQATGTAALTPDDLAQLPERPAVYRLLDVAGRVLYIGQTGNLRRRIAEHLRPTDSPTPKTLELARRVHALEYREVSSELEARLYEDRWIRRWRPPMNTAVNVRRARSRYPAGLAPIAMVAPSTEAGSVELFAWRPDSALWQVRVRAARPPVRRLRTLWRVLTGRRPAMPRGVGIATWGRIGAELAHRMFESQRSRWIWLRPDSFPDADTWIKAVRQAAEDAARSDREPAEYRWRVDMAGL